MRLSPAFAILLAACVADVPADTASEGDSDDTELVDTEPVEDTQAGPALAPDFALVDVNPASATGGQVVSPRDYLEKVSGWYVTHAT